MNEFKYKVGDKVVIIPEPDIYPTFWSHEMNKWCSKRMTIKEVTKYYYVMEEDAGDGLNDDGHWHWYDDFIDHAATETFAFGSKTVRRYVVIEEKYGYHLGQRVDFFPAGEIFETVRPILKEVLN